MKRNKQDDGYDVVIVGGGIVGAATLYQLQQRYPDRTMLLIEKETGLADHQTGNNSGVIHSGLYYPPGSLKAKNCVEGRRALVRFAQEHNIPHDVCGKVVVAVEDSELPMLEKIHGIGQQNEIEGLERINADQLREIEPHCKGIDALWVPCTGIIDYRAATKKMVDLALGHSNPRVRSVWARRSHRSNATAMRRWSAPTRRRRATAPSTWWCVEDCKPTASRARTAWT